MNKRGGFLPLSMIVTFVIVFAVVVTTILIFSGIGTDRFVKTIPDYRYEEEEDRILEAALELINNSEDVWIYITFDLQDGVSGFVWGQPDGGYQFGWHVIVEGGRTLPASAVGIYQGFRLHDVDERFNFGRGLTKIASSLDQSTDPNNVRARVEVYDGGKLVRNEEIYKSEDVDGEVDSIRERRKMLNAISEAYLEVIGETLDDDGLIEEIKLEDVVNDNWLKLVFTDGYDDEVFVKWDSDIGSSVVALRPNGEMIKDSEGREFYIQDPEDEIFDRPEVTKRVYSEDIALIKRLLRTESRSSLSEEVFALLNGPDVFVMDSGNLVNFIEKNRVSYLLYDVEDIALLEEQYSISAGESEEQDE